LRTSSGFQARSDGFQALSPVHVRAVRMQPANLTPLDWSEF
jgi:hypothetical protein